MEEVMENVIFRKYSTYKDSVLGKIPTHWIIRKLRHLGEFSASGIDKYIKASESPVKIINFTDVYSNVSKKLNGTFDYMVVSTPENNRLKNLVKKGDLIFLPSSETYEDLGSAALVDEELENTSFSYHVLRFEFNKEINHSFKKYFTNNDYVLKQFSLQGKGTTRKIIGRSVFKNIQVVLPPLNEQSYIATFLDNKTEQIDKAIAQKLQLIELLKEKKQILIHNAVTRGLNSTVSMKDSGVEWIGEIPAHWKIVTNYSLFEQRSERGNDQLPILSISIHTAVSSEELDDEDNIRGKIRIEDKSSYKLVKPNDIAFNMMRAWQGAIGSVSTMGMVSPAYIVVKPITTINSIFFEYQYRTDLFIQQMDRFSRGITDFRKRLYWNEFKRLFTILPPENEQREIVEFVENATAKIQIAVAYKQKEIEKLKEYKYTLINSAVTGKIKVS